MKERIKKLWEERRRLCLVYLAMAGAIVAILAVVGAITAGRAAGDKAVQWAKRRRAKPAIPVSKLPGPARRWGGVEFVLNDTNSCG